MRDRADKNVDRDHIAVNEDGHVDEAGPFVDIKPSAYRGNKLVTGDGRLMDDNSIVSRGINPSTTDAVAVSTEKANQTHVAGFPEIPPMVQPVVDRGGRSGIILRFFDAGTRLVKSPAGLRYGRSNTPEDEDEDGIGKKDLEDSLDVLMNNRAGKFLVRVDTGEEIPYSDIEDSYDRYTDLTTSRIIPTEMPFANIGGPLFGEANLGWNSVFHFLFKLNTGYDGPPRLSAPRGAYWMLRGTQNIETKNKKKDVVKDGEIIEVNIEYEEATDDSIDPNSIFPRQTFEVSWLGDGLPVELENDPEKEYFETPEGGMVANPDFGYRTKSGRMPVWRNVDHPQTLLDNRKKLKADLSENLSEHSDVSAFNESWSDKIEWAEDFVSEYPDEWNLDVDHNTLFFGFLGGNPRAARCIWKELAAGVYTIKVDALRSGFCGFDLTYPNRYKIGAFDNGFVKPSINGSDDVAQDLDLRVLQKGGNSSELHIYLRPRVFKFNGVTQYVVVYITFIFFIPIIAIDPAWLETSPIRYFLPWINANGFSYMVGGSNAAQAYADNQVPVPFNAALFSFTHGGGIPLAAVPVLNFWSVYALEHPKKDKDDSDGVPVAVIRKFDQTGKSQLYCVYYFDDDEENPINGEELMFTSEV